MKTISTLFSFIFVMTSICMSADARLVSGAYGKELILKGERQLQRGDHVLAKETFAKGVRMLKRCIKENPGDSTHHSLLIYGLNRLGDFHLRSGQNEKAKEYFNTSLTVADELLKGRFYLSEPRLSTIHNNQGYAAMGISAALRNIDPAGKKKYFDQAEDFYLKAMKINPADTSAALQNLFTLRKALGETTSEHKDQTIIHGKSPK